MSIAIKDNPVSWTVPSYSTPVDPKGPPYWPSKFSDIQVLDFGVQFSSDNTFEGIKAHW